MSVLVVPAHGSAEVSEDCGTLRRCCSVCLAASNASSPLFLSACLGHLACSSCLPVLPVVPPPLCTPTPPLYASPPPFMHPFHNHPCYAPPPTLIYPHPPTRRKRPKADGGSEWDTGVEATPAAGNRWDATPGGALGGATPGPNSWDATPGGALGGGSKWDATPGAGLTGATPAPRRNRWDETPAAVSWGAAVAVGSGGDADTRGEAGEAGSGSSSSGRLALLGLRGLGWVGCVVSGGPACERLLLAPAERT